MGELADGAETRITGLWGHRRGSRRADGGPGEDGIGAYLQGWADFASGVANFIVPVISALVPQIIKTGLANIWASTQAVAAGAAAKVMAAGQWLLNAALSANPIGLVVAAIALLVAAFVVAWNNSETFRNIVIGAWEGIKRAALAVVGWFQSYVAHPQGRHRPHRRVLQSSCGPRCKSRTGSMQEKGGQIVGWFKELPGKIGGFISGIAQVLTLPFRTAFNAIANLWNSTVGKLEFKAPRLGARHRGRAGRSRTFPRSVTAGTSPRPRAGGSCACPSGAGRVHRDREHDAAPLRWWTVRDGAGRRAARTWAPLTGSARSRRTSRTRPWRRWCER